MKLNQHHIWSSLDEPEQWSAPRKKTMKAKVWSPDAQSVTRFTDKGSPVTMWVNHLDTKVWQQASAFADLPFVYPKGLALMADVHFGKDVPVGSVLPTTGCLVPSAVGVDIGCGMMACRLNLKAGDLPSHLRPMRHEIETLVPVDKSGRHRIIPEEVNEVWKELESGWIWLSEKYPRAVRSHPQEQMGTLGSGNHFIEICVDENQDVWVLIHSGSRGSGSGVGQFFIEQALRRVRENGTGPQHGIAWLSDDDPLFHDYVIAVEWAQRFAFLNRKVMLSSILKAMKKFISKPIEITGEAVNCHHNYISREEHFGEHMWITRKGAIRAGVGEWGIIPGAMGQESFIVQGKGVAESYCSCSHGAGRVMSRSSAKNRFTVKDLREQTKNVECRKDKAVLDEIPQAYKPIKDVIAAQKSLLDVVHRLKAVLCVKGA